MQTKRIVFIFMLTGLSLIAFSAQDLLIHTLSKLSSPSGKYEFQFYQRQLTANTTQMYYTLSYQGKQVIKESELGVLIENQLFESALAIPNDTANLWCENLNFIQREMQTVEQSWQPIYGERSRIRDHYNELTLRFEKGADKKGSHDEGYDKRR